MRTSRISSRTLVWLLLAVGLGSCDFLSTEPKSELTTANFFTTADQAIQATNATYSMLRVWEVHVFLWIGMTDIASDDATKGSIPGDAPSIQGALDDLTWDSGNEAFRATWTGYYQGIYRANEAIHGIPGVPMDATVKARLIGENKFLRAYYYFFLARAYGGVPLITHPLEPSEYRQSRASRDAIYDLIVQDLTDASATLPRRSQYATTDLGRATKGAAQSLLAEAYLYRKDYAHALAYADSVIASGEYTLFPDYAGIFTTAGENSSESVFEVQSALTPGGGCQPSEGCSNVQYAEVQGVRGTPNIGWGFNTPSADLEAAYEAGDPRLEATILYPWKLLPDGSGRVVYLNPQMIDNNRFSQKVFVSPDNPGGTFNAGINIRRIRYADVLLMAAEAAYRTSDETKATTYLNQVRARARGTQSVTLGFTPEQLAESIAANVLGLAPGTSRVSVRYVNPSGTGYAAGLRTFSGGCANVSCAPGGPPPIRVDTLDIVQSVNGTPVTTVSDYVTALNTAGAGTSVTLSVLQMRRASPVAPLVTATVPVIITSEALLPDVTASGQALLDAIWHERRVELAMEQQRWFDIVRQGRVAQLMLALGKPFVANDTLYPIPTIEVASGGLCQNPGYGGTPCPP